MATKQWKVRRIALPKPPDVPPGIWLRVSGDKTYIYLDTLFGAWTLLRSRWERKLARWGGYASLAGGMIWIFLLMFWQLTALLWAAPDVLLLAGFKLLYHYAPTLDYVLLVIPLLLFLPGIVGMYAQQWRRRSRIAFVGLALSVMGVLLVVISTFFPDWFRDAHRYIAYGVYNLFSGDWIYAPFVDWIKRTWFGFILMSVGLVILALTVRRSKGLPRWSMNLFILSILGMYTVAPLLDFGLTALADALLFPHAYDVYVVVESLSSLTIMAALFGAAWISLGFALLKKAQALLHVGHST